jgi:hypothetical protein
MTKAIILTALISLALSAALLGHLVPGFVDGH